MRVHVVAGVIRDKTQRLLIAQHVKRDRYHGQWEFPGGKVETGETNEAALARELAEELGVDAQCSEPLIEVCYDYPDIRVRLSVLEVTKYVGVPHSREGQALRWVSEKQLYELDLLEANRPIAHAVTLPGHYVITDTRRYGVQATLTQLKYLLDGGIRLVQVREKHMPADDYARFMQAVLELCRRFDALVLGNTDPETAVALGAHGIHLDSRRLQELDRRPLGAELWVAASCHDRRELDHARQIGADFAVLSPVKATRTHSDARTLGWSRFGALCRHADFPVYALGGMTRDDTCRARHAGGQGVAMISGAWESTGHI